MDQSPTTPTTLLMVLCICSPSITSTMSSFNVWSSYVTTLFSKQCSIVGEGSISETTDQGNSVGTKQKIIGGVLALGTTGMCCYFYWKHLVGKNRLARVQTFIMPPYNYDDCLDQRNKPRSVDQYDATQYKYNEPLTKELRSLEKNLYVAFNGASLNVSHNFEVVRPQMQRLIEQGANPNSIVHTAVACNDLPFITVCLDYGANPNLDIPPSAVWIPPVPLLSRAKTVKAAQLLVSYGANVHQVDRYGENLLHKSLSSSPLFYFLCSSGVNPNQKNNWGKTPLHSLANVWERYKDDLPDLDYYSAQKEDREKIAALIWANATLASRDNKWQTPISRFRYRDPDSYSQVQAITSVTSQVKAEYEKTNKETPIILAQYIGIHPTSIVTDYTQLTWEQDLLPTIVSRAALLNITNHQHKKRSKKRI